MALLNRELIEVPDPKLFEVLAGEIRIVPGCTKGASLYAQANASGDEVDLRLQSQKAKGLVCRTISGDTPHIQIKHNHISCQHTGERLTLKFTPESKLSRPSHDRKSNLMNQFVSNLSVSDDFDEWRFEWLRTRTSSGKNTRVTFSGKNTETPSGLLDEVMLEYKSDLPYEVVFPEELLHLERWFFGRTHLPRMAERGQFSSLVLPATHQAKETIIEILWQMHLLKLMLDASRTNLDSIANSVRITSENCFTARDCASIFPA